MGQKIYDIGFDRVAAFQSTVDMEQRNENGKVHIFEFISNTNGTKEVVS